MHGNRLSMIKLRPLRARCAQLLGIASVIAIVAASGSTLTPTALGTVPPPNDVALESFLPIVFNGPCTVAAPRKEATVFGVQMYGNTSARSPYFEPLMALNAGWVRAEIDWNRIEPTNRSADNFQWGVSDRVLAAAIEGGANMIVTIGRNPEWASPHEQGPIDPDHLDDFGDFMAALVERYDGDGIDDDPCRRVVKHWELYNEPDGGSKPGDVRWGNFGAEYAEMLAVVYPAVKAADPEAKILLGGIAYDWFDDQTAQPGPFVRSFVPDVLAAGGGAYFDVMNFHVYPAFAPNWVAELSDGPGLLEKSQALRSLLAEYGLEKPMMITEAGSHSNADGTTPRTPEEQASYVVALYTQSLAADVDAMIWFMLYDPPEWYPNKNGLMTAEDPPGLKLAYHTYQRTAERLAQLRFERVLSAEELGNDRMLGYRFANDGTGQTVYVVWMAPVYDEQGAALRLPGASAQVLDIFGTINTVNDGGRGTLQFEVTNRPLIIEVNP